MKQKDRELFTYEASYFLLLILSTRTVIVMPRSTPAANNKAITLMTSLVAICGNGFSAEKKTQQHTFKEKIQKLCSTENLSVKH